MLPDSLTPAEAQPYLRAGARLIDVREADEFEELHVAAATLIPLAAVEQRMAEIPMDANVIVMCRSGRRSGIAQQQLRERGYARVANLSGGILAWDEDGFPVERG